jgi:hypothetical protein
MTSRGHVLDSFNDSGEEVMGDSYSGSKLELPFLLIQL